MGLLGLCAWPTAEGEALFQTLLHPWRWWGGGGRGEEGSAPLELPEQPKQ